MRRGRRKQRYTWFPINPTFIGENSTPWTFYYGTSEVPAVIGGTPTIVAVPILQDQDQQTGQSDDGISLRDRVEGKDYALERVVGKVWCSLSQLTADGVGEYTATQALVAMGLAILPVDDNTGQPSLNDRDYDPLVADNSAAPWMWRRTWLLYNNLATPSPIFTGPTNIGSYGSVMDGGHVDVKSARRVRREQRLFWCLSVVTIGTTGSGDVPVSQDISWGYDFRVLGAMRKARNESTFK